MPATTIKAIDSTSIHRITSGQVVIDLQTAVKELVENSLDAGATSIDVRFKEYGLKNIEVIDNGHGIAPEDYHSIALKHHTSKLASFEDLGTVLTFGFRGEALSSLCALSSAVTVTTATAAQAPMGTILELERSGKVRDQSGKVARQRGTSITIVGLFTPLPVRRKEFERNAKREYGKALNLLHAYALVPCTKENKGVRLTVSNHPDKGARSVQIRTDGIPSSRASVSALWGPKSLENIVPLDLHLEVEAERSSVLKKRGVQHDGSTRVEVRGLISKFSHGCGRTSTDRQFFYVNGRPCNPSKVQKAFNEVYRSFNTNQVPFLIADFQLPTGACDINVSPDKRTIFIHSENSLVHALKASLEETFSSSRSTFTINGATSKDKEKAGLRQPNSDREGSSVAGSDRSRGPSEPDEEEDAEAPDGADENTDAPSVRSKWRRGENASQEDTTETAVSRRQTTVAPAPPSRSRSRSRPNDAAELIVVERDQGSASEREEGNKDVDMDNTNEETEGAITNGIPTPDISISIDEDEKNSSDHESDSSGRPDHDTPADASCSRPRVPLFLPSLSPAPQPHNSQIVAASTSRPQDRPPSPLSPSLHLSEPDDQEEPPRKRARTSSPSPAPQSTKSRPVQMVLGTAGAAWSMQIQSNRGDKGADVRMPKKSKAGGAAAAASARDKIRSRLNGFAGPGSQVKPIHVDDEASGSEREDDADAMEVEPQEGEEMEHDVEVKNDVSRNDRVRRGTGRDISARGTESPTIDLTHDIEDDNSEIPGLVQQDLDEPAGEAPPRPEIVRTTASGLTLRFDLHRLSSTWSCFRSRVGQYASLPATSSPSTGLHRSASVAKANDAEGAERELARVIHKEDFASMNILGQFNLGFIITRRVALEEDGSGKRGADDLFIVDQHAADEKYNFETLQQTTKIESQKLFQPRPLELTAADELVAMENVEILRSNGFEVAIDEDARAGQGERVRLVAQPVSKGTTFDMKDLAELLHLMQDRPSGQMVRCSKARAMFAMRACRKSVMVGMPLTTGQMTSVVRHMGTMDQPWNCPHGRPTMRHLVSLSAVDRGGNVCRDVDWTRFAG